MELWMIALACVASAVAGGYVSVQKRRPVLEGLVLGALFGPFGLVAAACLPDDGKTADARAQEAWQREQE